MTRKSLNPCPRRRDARQRQRCDSAIAWSVEAAVACAPPTGAMHRPSLIAMMSVPKMTMSPDCSPGRARAPVVSTTSARMLTIWKESKTCVFLFVLMRTACACGFGSDASEQEVPLEQLSDIKAKSIVEWIANDRVRRSIVKNFRQFLMTYVDDHGASVYGQRIRALGESA